MISTMSNRETPLLRTPDENFADLANFPYEPHYVEVDGLRMHYIDEGPADAAVALMLHGMPTWSYLYRSIIPPMLAAGYRCIAPDHIGFGRSDKVTDPGWYDIARHTANMSLLIESLDLRDVTMFVQDWGGPIGLAQVATMPERFSRLVIMNTWLHHDGYEYTAAIQNWITQNQPGGIFRDHVPDRFGWGTLMVVGTRRATPQEALFPALQGNAAVLSPDVEASDHASSRCAYRSTTPPAAALTRKPVTSLRSTPPDFRFTSSGVSPTTCSTATGVAAGILSSRTRPGTRSTTRHISCRTPTVSGSPASCSPTRFEQLERRRRLGVPVAQRP